MRKRSIPYNFDATREIQTCKNREIIKWFTKIIILCGKQFIVLRGHREDIHNSSNNSGNYLVIFKLLLETNSDLKHQLDAPSTRNATYISPRIEKELIVIINYDNLQRELVEEVKEAKFFFFNGRWGRKPPN